VGLREAFADPLLGADAVPDAEVTALAAGSPNAARAVLALYRAWRVAREDAGGIALPSGRRILLPTEEVRDYFNEHANHFPALEAAAEDAQLSPKGVSFTTAIDETVQVLADPDQLHRLFVNLMRNAREAIDGDRERNGVGNVTAELAVEDGASFVRIADDGPGLPERAQANLFQPFQGSGRQGGAGLGLAISRELAQAHGGELTLVETGPGRTVFELRLPGAPDPSPPRRGGRAAAPAGA